VSSIWLVGVLDLAPPSARSIWLRRLHVEESVGVLDLARGCPRFGSDLPRFARGCPRFGSDLARFALEIVHVFPANICQALSCKL